VIQADGKVYAAWMMPQNNKIHYVTNAPEGNKVQEDIARWSKRFDNE
jgi:hypothetical protein